MSLRKFPPEHFPTCCPCLPRCKAVNDSVASGRETLIRCATFELLRGVWDVCTGRAVGPLLGRRSDSLWALREAGGCVTVVQ